MDKLYVLDAYSASVFIIKPSQKQLKKYLNKYEENVEAWLTGEGIDEENGICVSCCQYMWVEDDNDVIEVNV